MKNKILGTLMAGAAIATMGIMSAKASTLDDVSGPIEFVYNAWDAAQVTYNPLDADIDGFVCETVGDCNVASIGAGGTAGADGSNGAVADDDTWGVGKVTSIINQNGLGDPQWQTSSSENLFVYFYGFNDEVVQIVNGRTFTYSTGGYADVYVVTTSQADALFLAADQAALELAIAALALPTYLELEFIHNSADFNEAPCSATYASSTLCGNFDTASLSGQSIGYAQTTGGTALSKYQDDFQFVQNFVPCASALINNCLTGTSYNLRIGTGNIRTTALPEPGALGLLGLGLVGMGLLARRRKV